MNVSHETAAPGGLAGSHDWLTPRWILDALGPFDLDPCASMWQPWPTAARQLTVNENGLSQEWRGRVWCNPPYGPHAAEWLARCAAHGNAIALVFARTDTEAFHRYVWRGAAAVLFLRGRVEFLRPGGHPAGRSGAPSVLIAFDQANAAALRSCGLDGAFLPIAGQS